MFVMTTSLPEDRRPTTAETALREPAGLGPPQFSMRGLLLVVAAFCLLFALLGWVGATWSIALVTLLVLLVGHVLGNALGTRLRDASTVSLRATRDAGASAPSTLRSEPIATRPAPTSHLHATTRLGRHVHLLVLVGVAAGGSAGMLVLAAVYWPDITWAALALGGLSAAVLGGWATLLGSAFWSSTRRAWREAVDHHNNNRS